MHGPTGLDIRKTGFPEPYGSGNPVLRISRPVGPCMSLTCTVPPVWTLSILGDFSSPPSKTERERAKPPFRDPICPVHKDRVYRGLFPQAGLQNRGQTHGYFQACELPFCGSSEAAFSLAFSLAYSHLLQPKKDVKYLPQSFVCNDG